MGSPLGWLWTTITPVVPGVRHAGTNTSGIETGVLVAPVLPGLSAEIITSRFITPEHFQSELSSLYGSGFSVEPTLTQSAYLRPHNQSEDVDGLYFVGGGTR